MPRGYGMGRGGYWWYNNRRPWWPTVVAEPVTDADVKKGLTYIGPCRCGFGPHAYYRTADGRIVHAAAAPYAGQAAVRPEPEPAPDQDELQTELDSLRARVQELEKKLAEKSRAGRQ